MINIKKNHYLNYITPEGVIYKQPKTKDPTNAKKKKEKKNYQPITCLRTI